MRLVFEISREELIAALQASENETVSIPNAKPAAAVSAPKAGATAKPAAAPAAEKGRPGRKSNAQKAAEAAAAAAAAESEADTEELDLDAELTEQTGAGDDLDGLLDDDPEIEAAEEQDELIGDDNTLKKKLADALQANKKKNNGKAGPATDILRKYAPNLSISEVKKKDVPSLLKDLAK